MAKTQPHGSQIKDDTITNAKVKSDAAVALSKLAESVIQADGGQAFTGEQSMGSNKLTNLAAPTGANDAARKADVDAAKQGLDLKDSVRVATTANITLSGEQTIDGVTTSADRVLVKNQSTASENGIYVSAAGAWARSADADADVEVTSGMFTFVEEGTVNADSGWELTTNDPITVGTTALAFAQFSGAGQITAGAGLTKSGNTIDVGAGNGITVNADDVEVKPDATGGANLAKAVDVNANGLAVKVDDVSIEGNGSDQLQVKALGISTAMVATNAIDENKLKSHASTDSLRAVTTDHVKDSAITAAKIANGAADENKIPAAAIGDGLVGGGGTVIAINRVTHETPGGAVDGANTAFTLAATPVAGTEEVFLNGIRQEPGSGNDYTISVAAITYLTAPVSGDKIRVGYFK